MRNQHNFPQSVPVIDLSKFTRECGHTSFDPCQCRQLPNGLGWVDPCQEEWLDELEAAK